MNRSHSAPAPRSCARIRDALRRRGVVSLVATAVLSTAGCADVDGDETRDDVASTADELGTPEATGLYTLVNRCSGQLLDVRSASREQGAPVVQWPRNGTDAQTWRLESAGAGSLQLVSVNSGLALTVGDDGRGDAPTEQRTWRGKANQRWLFTASRDGWYRISPLHATDLALDVRGASESAGTVVQVHRANGTCAQQWSLQPKGKSPSGASSRFTIATWNSAFSNSGDMVASSRKLGARAEIIGFQEMHKPGKRKDLREGLLCDTCEYSGYVEDYSHDGSSPASLPIVWNHSLFAHAAHGSIKVSDAVSGIDDSTGDDAKVSAKFITWVKLQDIKTARYFYVLNTHTVASVESGGKPNENTARLRLYDRHMDKLVAKVTELRAEGLPVFVAGDFNVSYRKDVIVRNAAFPYARLAALGVHSNWELTGLAGIAPTAETEGASNRLIDYVFSLDRPEVRANATSIGPDSFGSDHFPVLFDVTIAPR